MKKFYLIPLLLCLIGITLKANLPYAGYYPGCTLTVTASTSGGASSTICSGNSVGLLATASSGTAPYTYLWTPATGLNNTAIINPTATPTVTTTYTIHVTDHAGCTASAAIKITVNQPPVINPDSLLLQYLTNKPLKATGGVPPYTYAFSPVVGTNSLLDLPDTNTTFTITVTGANGCASTYHANYVALLSESEGGGCTTVYMTQYIQDTLHNDDAIQLFNPTLRAINLSSYYLTGSTNGSWLSPPFLIQLHGTIKPHQTFLIVNTHADTVLTDKANMLSDSLSFKGKDIVTLVNGVINSPTLTFSLLDQVGTLSPLPSDTGWIVGSGSTKNHTLVRQASVNQGTMNWTVGKTQWNVYPVATFNKLGRYRNICTLGDPNLTLTFANATTTCGTSRYFEFDVMVSSDQPTWFDNCVMWIPYDAMAFGNDIVTNGNVTVTAYPSFGTPTYYNPQLNLSDESPDTLHLPFGTDQSQSSWSRTQINSTPQQMLHVKIKIQNCNHPADIFYTDTSFAQVFSYYTVNQSDSIINAIPYNYTYYMGDIEDTLCEMKITEYTNPINVGTNDKSTPANSSMLTIKGLGFGNTKGSGAVFIPNANNGGSNYITLDSLDILSWSNNQIIVKMPSVMISEDTMTPGSGGMTLYNDCGDAVAAPLTINYNIMNRHISNEKLRLNMSMSNDSNSLVFRCDTSISNHLSIYAVVLQAIETWNCYTGVHWKMGTDTTLESHAQDGVSNIYFSTTSLGTPLMETYTHMDNSCNSIGDSMVYLHEADIAINRFLPAGYSWDYNVSDTVFPGNHYYFYDALLHELGHAHLLNHVDDPTSLMYYQASVLVRKNILSGDYPGPQTLYGAFDVVNTSAANTPSCAYGILVPSFKGCTDSTLNVSSIPKNEYQLIVYPNPVSNGNITIGYDLTKDSYIQFKIIDYTGKEVIALGDEHQSPGSYKEQINTDAFAKGIYLLVANINGNIQTIKFIKL